jgi:hypothetical protein
MPFHHHHHQYLRRGTFVYDLNIGAPDDDSSTSSTMPTVNAKIKLNTPMIETVNVTASTASSRQEDPQDYNVDKKSSLSTTRTTIRKSMVRFDVALNKEYENTEMCFEECRFLWYSSRQLQTFKDSNYAHAEDIIQSEKAMASSPLSYKRLLRLTYKACCHCQENDEDIEEADEDGNSIVVSLTPSQQEALELLLGHNDLALCRLGMDRMIVRSIARDMHLRRKEMQRFIYQLQEMKMTTSNSSDDKDDKKLLLAEMIRSRCQALSRPARLYARHLAQAQAAS